MSSPISTPDEPDKALDDIMEDLIVGHNFEYARKELQALIRSKEQEIERKHLRLLAAVLYQLGGRLELGRSSVEAIGEEFTISQSDIVPEIDTMILSLEDAAQLSQPQKGEQQS